jgi:hypothetical protein
MSYRDQEQKESRVARVPFGGPRLKLQLSAEDRQKFVERGMVPRWINDQDGRLARAQSGGYNYVKSENAGSLGQGALHQGNTSQDSRVSKVVSRGEPVITSYLMEITKEYYDEDQATKETHNSKVDNVLAGDTGGAAVENAYGSGVTYSH